MAGTKRDEESATASGCTASALASTSSKESLLVASSSTWMRLVSDIGQWASAVCTVSGDGAATLAAIAVLAAANVESIDSADNADNKASAARLQASIRDDASLKTAFAAMPAGHGIRSVKCPVRP